MATSVVHKHPYIHHRPEKKEALDRGDYVTVAKLDRIFLFHRENERIRDCSALEPNAYVEVAILDTSEPFCQDELPSEPIYIYHCICVVESVDVADDTATLRMVKIMDDFTAKDTLKSRLDTIVLKTIKHRHNVLGHTEAYPDNDGGCLNCYGCYETFLYSSEKPRDADGGNEHAIHKETKKRTRAETDLSSPENDRQAMTGPVSTDAAVDRVESDQKKRRVTTDDIIDK